MEKAASFDTIPEQGALRRHAIRRVLITLGFGMTILIDLLYNWGGWDFSAWVLVGVQDLIFIWTFPLQLANAAVFLALALLSRYLKPKHIRLILPLAAAAIATGHLVLIMSDGLSLPSIFITLAAFCIGGGISGALVCWILLLAHLVSDESYVLILAALGLQSLLFLVVSNLPSPASAAAPLVLVVLVLVCGLASVNMAAHTSAYHADESLDRYASQSTQALSLPLQSESTPSKTTGLPLQETSSPLQPSAAAKSSFPLIKSIVLLRNPLFCAASIVFAVPITRISALMDEVNIEWMNPLAALAILLVCLVLFLMRYGPGRSSNILGSIDIPNLFKFTLPLVATLLVCYTIFGASLALPVSVTVFVLFYLVWLLMIPTCISVAQRLQVSSLLCYGTVSCIVNLVFAGSTLLGHTLLTNELVFGAATLSVCMLLVLYVLMMTFTFQNRGNRGKAMDEHAAGQNDGTSTEHTLDNLAIYGDRPSRAEYICQELARQHFLTPREYDILLLLARGRDTPYIATELFISKNTVRTHIKSVYVKVNVHSRQELIDLVEELCA